jgi:hypothetical protein
VHAAHCVLEGIKKWMHGRVETCRRVVELACVPLIACLKEWRHGRVETCRRVGELVCVPPILCLKVWRIGRVETCRCVVELTCIPPIVCLKVSSGNLGTCRLVRELAYMVLLKET